MSKSSLSVSSNSIARLESRKFNPTGIYDEEAGLEPVNNVSKNTHQMTSASNIFRRNFCRVEMVLICLPFLPAVQFQTDLLLPVKFLSSEKNNLKTRGPEGPGALT